MSTPISRWDTDVHRRLVLTISVLSLFFSLGEIWQNKRLQVKGSEDPSFSPRKRTSKNGIHVSYVKTLSPCGDSLSSLYFLHPPYVFWWWHDRQGFKIEQKYLVDDNKNSQTFVKIKHKKVSKINGHPSPSPTPEWGETGHTLLVLLQKF